MEFEYEEVAKIAAEAMDNYLMFDKLLQCKYHPNILIERTPFGKRICTQYANQICVVSPLQVNLYHLIRYIH